MLMAGTLDSSPLFTVAEADLEVRAVAEGLVGGGAAAAKRHPVTYLVGEAVGGDHRDSATQPQRTAHLLGGLLDHPDRARQRRLDRCAARALPGDQPPRGTVTHLPKKVGAHRRVIGPGDLVPHLAVRYAEV